MRPPVFGLLGQSVSQDAKLASLGKRDMSMPHSHDRLRGDRVDGFDLSQIDATDPMQFGAKIEVRFVLPAAALLLGRDGD
jgi:hypothetical protein